MSIKGQQLRIHFWDFTTYIINLNWTSRPQDCQSRDNTLLGFNDLYNNFKLDTTTIGMPIKGQQLRTHFWDFNTYIITLNWTPQPQECRSKDIESINCLVQPCTLYFRSYFVILTQFPESYVWMHCIYHH